MYMGHLETSGFVKRYNQWSLKTSKQGKQSLYSISDPYARLYLKYIQPRYEQIMTHKLETLEISSSSCIISHWRRCSIGCCARLLLPNY